MVVTSSSTLLATRLSGMINEFGKRVFGDGSRIDFSSVGVTCSRNTKRSDTVTAIRFSSRRNFLMQMLRISVVSSLQILPPLVKNHSSKSAARNNASPVIVETTPV